MRRCGWLLVGVLATTATAQVRREPSRGSATTADGQAWVGATVHLLSRPLPGDERIGVADEVRATTDEKGRFLVQLLPGRRYVAWAVQTLGEDRYVAALPVEDIVAGRPLELVADAPLVQKRIEFTGLAAWREHGAVVVTLLSATTPTHVLTLTPEGNAVVLPPLPGRRVHMLVTVGGLPLSQWPATIDLTEPTPHAAKLPSPRAVRVRVHTDTGKGVDGACLYLRTHDVVGEGRTLRHAIGRTDSSGVAVVTLPLPPGKFGWINYKFGVEAPGQAPIHNVERVEIAADHDASRPDAAIVVRVPAGEQYRLRIVDGEKPVQAPLMLRSRGGSTGEAFTSDLPNLPLASDCDGRIDVCRVKGAVVIVLAEAAVVAPTQPTLHAIALLGCIPSAGGPADVTFDVAKLQPLALHVVDATGTPVDAANIALLVADRDGPVRALTGIGTDRSGRVAVLAPNDLQITVVAWTSSGCAVVAVPAAPRPAGAPLRLQLTPVAHVPGVVTGKHGEPVAGASVQAWVSGRAGDGRALGCAIRMAVAGTSRDGTFRLPLYPGLDYSLRGVVTPDDERYFDQHWTVGRDAPEQLAIDLTQAR